MAALFSNFGDSSFSGTCSPPDESVLWRRRLDLGILDNWTGPHCWIRSAPILRMLGPAKIYFMIFGILTIAGGVMGYVKAGSAASIVAGAISGILLLIGAWLLPQHETAGLVLSGLVSLLLVGYFVPKFMRTGALMPAGMMSALSAIGIVLAIVAWVKK